jgi:hypothetical protein
MKPAKFIATLAVAGGLAAGAVGLGAGVASADPGPWYGNGHGWHGDGHGRGWDGPRWGGGDWRDPVPGGWNGGWEPWGGVCLFGACI